MKKFNNKNFGKLFFDISGNSFLLEKGNLIPIEIVIKSNDKTDSPIIYKREIQEGNEIKTIFGLINKEGIAVTPAVYTYMKIDEKGKVVVSIFKDYADRSGYILSERCCEINMDGHPFVNGNVVKECSFVKYLQDNYWLCWNGVKMGICNRFGFLLIPCEYDQISYRPDWNAFQLKQGDEFYTALMSEKEAIINIIKGNPLIETYFSKYLVAWWTQNSEVSSWYYTLLDYGGSEILCDRFSEIKIYSDCYVAAKKGQKWSLYFILFRAGLKPHVTVLLTDLDNISYGTGKDNTGKKYVVINNSNESNLYFLQGAAIKNILKIYNGKIIFSNEEYDPEIMDYEKMGNEFFVIEKDGDKSIYNIQGEKVVSIQVPENCERLLTHTFGEGLIGYKAKNKQLGYIDFYGNVVIPPNLDYVGPFENGRAKVKRRFTEFSPDDTGDSCENTATYIINKLGQILESKIDYIFRRNDQDLDQPDGYDWRKSLDDAMEGDSGAYWNID